MNKRNLTPRDLIMYEMPLIAEFISINWLQNILAKYTAHKVTKKMARFNKRVDRKELISKFIKDDK